VQRLEQLGELLPAGVRVVRGEQPQVFGFWIITVSTPVGCTVLTRIACLPNSLARVRMMPMTPCLAAV